MENKICYLIDDDDDDREIFQTALTNIGEPVCFMTAHSGSEALDKLQQENFTPDYIFIDMHMPVIDGKKCLSEIKKINRFKDIPIVIYTTSVCPKDMDDARELGAAAYISKPYSIKNLENSLQTFFLEYHLKYQKV
jgi:CheY-like chemotaxis protein